MLPFFHLILKILRSQYTFFNCKTRTSELICESMRPCVSSFLQDLCQYDNVNCLKSFIRNPFTPLHKIIWDKPKFLKNISLIISFNHTQVLKQREPSFKNFGLSQIILCKSVKGFLINDLRQLTLSYWHKSCEKELTQGRIDSQISSDVRVLQLKKVYWKRKIFNIRWKKGSI
jgi:hypothetical protein